MSEIAKLDGTSVKAVAELVHPEPNFQEVHRGQYLWMAGDKKELIGNPYLATPKALEVTTLSAIVDAFASPMKDSWEPGTIVQVVSPVEVRVVAPAVGEEKQQFTYIVAKAQIPTGMTFGKFYPMETFIINLLSLFGETPEREQVLQFAGNLTAGLKADIVDDGVSQNVVAAKGLTRAGNLPPFKNPAKLQPFRTFAEAGQPESNFVLRLDQVNEREDRIVAMAALFEADGGAWRCEAIENIGRFFKEHLPGVTVLA